MAEQAAGAVASAVIGGVTDRALSTVIRKLRSRSRSRPAATDEKLQRLETLVLKLRCAVEVSEKHAIGSASLLEWRDRLRVAAAEGGAVVLDFQRRAREEEDQGEAAATSASAPGQPAGTIASTSNLYFTRSALSGMAQRVRDATRRLFSTDEDMQKLDTALEKMERLSPDITQFLMALQLEVSAALGQQAAKRSATALIPAERRRRKLKVKTAERRLKGRKPFKKQVKESTEAMPVSSDELPPLIMLSVERSPLHPKQRPRKAVAASEITHQLASAEEAEDGDREARMLATKLDRWLRRMVSYIKKTDGRDMAGLEWLAEWAVLLREAVERGNAVRQTLRSGSDAIHKQAGGGALEEDGELYSFARAVQRLVLDDAPFWWWTYELVELI